MDEFSFQYKFDTGRRKHRKRFSNVSTCSSSVLDMGRSSSNDISVCLEEKLAESLDLITGVERDAGMGDAHMLGIRHAILSTLRPNEIIDNGSRLHEYWHLAATNPYVWEPSYCVSRCSALRGRRVQPTTSCLYPTAMCGSAVDTGGKPPATDSTLGDASVNIPVNENSGAIAAAAASLNTCFRGYGRCGAEYDVCGDKGGFNEDPPAAGLRFPSPMMYKVVLESCEIHWSGVEDLTFFSIPSSAGKTDNGRVQNNQSPSSTTQIKDSKRSTKNHMSAGAMSSSFGCPSSTPVTAFTRGVHGIFTQHHSPFWLRALAILHVLCRNGKFLASSFQDIEPTFVGPHVVFEKMHILFLLYAEVLTSHQVSPQPSATLWLLCLYEWAATQNTAESTTANKSFFASSAFYQQTHRLNLVGQESSNQKRDKMKKPCSGRKQFSTNKKFMVTSPSNSELLFNNDDNLSSDSLKNLHNSNCIRSSKNIRENIGVRENHRQRIQERENNRWSANTANKTILPFHKMMIAPAAIILRSELTAPLPPHALYSIIRLTTQMIDRYVRGCAYLLQPSSLVLGDPTPLHAADPRACYGIYILLLMKYPMYRECVQEVVFEHFGEVGMWELEMARSRVGGLVAAHDLKNQPERSKSGRGDVCQGNKDPNLTNEVRHASSSKEGGSKDESKDDVSTTHNSPFIPLDEFASMRIGSHTSLVMNSGIEAERVPYDDEIDRVFIPNN